MRSVLKPDGLFLPLNFGAREVWHLLRQKLFGGPRLALHVSGDRAEDLAALAGMIAEGQLRPVVDRRFPLSEIVPAHRYVEGRHRKGAVVIDVAEPPVARAA
jgi:NADPH:quinone reductase-like Zn-dependent oxidoreductase